MPNTYVIKLVYLLEMQQRTCSRMETATFIVILETILQAPFSQEKERAVYLLAVGSVSPIVGPHSQA